jgi:hypothetical protein
MFVLLVLMSAEIVALVFTNNMNLELRRSYASSERPPIYESYELFIAKSFNRLFFAYSNGLCDSVTSILFWGFITNRCPPDLSEETCKKCFTYGVGSCVSDAAVCYADGKENGLICPYVVCKVGVLSYILDKLG